MVQGQENKFSQRRREGAGVVVVVVGVFLKKSTETRTVNPTCVLL